MASRTRLFAFMNRKRHLALLSLLSFPVALLFLPSRPVQTSGSVDLYTSAAPAADTFANMSSTASPFYFVSPPPKVAAFRSGSPLLPPKVAAFESGSPSLPPKVAAFGSGSPLLSDLVPLVPPPVPSSNDVLFSNSPVLRSPSDRGPAPPELVIGKEKAKKRGGGRGQCDLYNGRWVRDEEGIYPLYSPGQCPFVDQAFACQENGRKDKDYMKWRWKPYGCDLPRFNATEFLEMLRGKVMMFVGDSLSRNQFGSFLCLLREALPVKGRMYEKRGYKISRERGHFTVHFRDYNCSVKYQRSYYLVQQGTRQDEKGKTWPTLHLDQIDKSASRWKSADILVFNTGSWWNKAKTNMGRNFYQEGSVVYPRFSHSKAYRRGLRTWAAWIEKNLDPRSKIVFFRGLGTSHFMGGAWNSGGTCAKDIKPAVKGRILDFYTWKMKIVEEIIAKMRFPIALMNVTKLTNFRMDAHPSIYGGVWVVPGSKSERREDCSHWCLPGVPDTWNELLYSNLVS